MSNSKDLKDFSLHPTFSRGHFAKIAEMRLKGKSWPQIQKHLFKSYGIDRARSTIIEAFQKVEHMFDMSDDKQAIELLKESARVKKNNTVKAKQNRMILEYVNQQDDMLLKLQDYLDKKKFTVQKPKVKPKTSDKKPNMTMEVMYTDVHMGKSSETFNRQVCIDRTKAFMETVRGEYERYSRLYNIERLVLFLGGDNIENANIHGIESTKGCEAPTPVQVVWYIESVFENILLPVSEMGVDVDVVCIAGNHDRQDEKKTFHYPGYDSEAWIMYNTLEKLTHWSGLKGFTWHIPKGVFHTLDIYGNTILYEHGDHVKGTSRAALNAHLHKRSQQIGRLITGLRCGHWHEYLCMDEGRAVINASVCGTDSYAEVLGYSSKAGQVINYYIDSERDNSFYHSFLAQLE
jgi:hypothetical protein